MNLAAKATSFVINFCAVVVVVVCLTNLPAPNERLLAPLIVDGSRQMGPRSRLGGHSASQQNESIFLGLIRRPLGAPRGPCAPTETTEAEGGHKPTGSEPS